MRSIPCHLITGPLGVGKTTAVLQYLKRHAANQFIAVLVNDFGPVGLDGAIMEGALGVDARENVKLTMVPGGCICCSAATGVIGAFQKLAELPRLDRIIVEPSGLALTGDMIDLLRSVQVQYRLDLRPVITLLDPRDIDKPAYSKVPYYVRLIEGADVLVANRCDLSPPEKVDRFRQWASALYPPKLRIITTDHGQLPEEVFELRAGRDGAVAAAAQIAAADPLHSYGSLPVLVGAHDAPHHHTTGHTSDQHAGGFVLPADVQFVAGRLEDLLGDLAAGRRDGIALDRLKGIFNTDEGWLLMEIARGDVFRRRTDYRRDVRVDWISNQPTTAECIQKLILTTAGV